MNSILWRCIHKTVVFEFAHGPSTGISMGRGWISKWCNEYNCVNEAAFYCFPVWHLVWEKIEKRLYLHKIMSQSWIMRGISWEIKNKELVLQIKVWGFLHSMNINRLWYLILLLLLCFWKWKALHANGGSISVDNKNEECSNTILFSLNINQKWHSLGH